MVLYIKSNRFSNGSEFLRHIFGIFFFHKRQQHRVTYAVRQIVYAAQLMRHRMHITKPRIIESQSAKEYRVYHLFTRFDIMAILHSTSQISKNKLHCG
ncbi:hypothetical protein D3C76_1227850 [compost metagenome]